MECSFYSKWIEKNFKLPLAQFIHSILIPILEPALLLISWLDLLYPKASLGDKRFLVRSYVEKLLGFLFFSLLFLLFCSILIAIRYYIILFFLEFWGGRLLFLLWVCTALQYQNNNHNKLLSRQSIVWRCLLGMRMVNWGEGLFLISFGYASMKALTKGYMDVCAELHVAVAMSLVIPYYWAT